MQKLRIGALSSGPDDLRFVLISLLRSCDEPDQHGLVLKVEFIIPFMNISAYSL